MNHSPPERSLPPSPPSPPSLTRLYHLEPLGIGGPLVESLTSYIARLAAAHSVRPMRLIVDEIAPRAGKRYAHSIRATQQFFADWRHTLALCGSGPVARDWIRALEQLTGRSDLAQLTLVSLNHVVTAPTSTTLRRERSWCPECYDHWRNGGDTPYAPLLWMMRAVTRCPIHHTPVARRCPHAACGRTTSWLVGQYHQGRCLACDSWLGRTSQVAVPSAPSLSPMTSMLEQGVSTEALGQIRASEIVGALLVVSAGRQSPASTPDLEQSLARWRGTMTPRLLKHVQRRTGVTARMLDAWSAGISRPSLTQLLSLHSLLDRSFERRFAVEQ